MKTASITETKNRLSGLLDEVRRGETILIMDRNHPIARIEPIMDTPTIGEDGRLALLERQGLLQRGNAPLSRKFMQVKPPSSDQKASLLEALLAEREENR